jgi:hypothetical protein
MSSGTFGAKIALELLKKMHPQRDELVFLRSEHSKSPFAMNINWSDGMYIGGFEIPVATDKDLIDLLELRILHNIYRNAYDERIYKNFNDYQNVFRSWTPRYDVVVLAAAVSDYVVKNYVDGKIRSSADFAIELEPAPKIISMIKRWSPNAKLVGFKLLVNSTDEELIEASKDSIAKNGCDMVVANDLRDIVAGKHRVLLVAKDGSCVEHKQDEDPNYLANEVARRIINLGESDA